MIYKRLRHFSVSHRSTLRSWRMSMKDLPCFIIGNGPSLSDQPINDIKDFFTIGINRAFRVIDPTILIWQDIELWITERKNLPRIDAIKYCRDIADPENVAYHFKLAYGGYQIPNDPLVLHGHGSTGPLAFQLSCILGCNPIILLGCDCSYRGDKTNFWGNNKFHKPHTLVNCKRGLKWVCKTSQSANKTIINCSENKIFGEQISLPDAIKMVKNKYVYTGRDFFIGNLFGLANSLIPDRREPSPGIKQHNLKKKHR